MKVFKLALLLVLLTATQAFAKVVYLDNKTTANSEENLYVSFAAAYAACTTPGDTIYVMGSVDSYGSIEINKQIAIIGPGFFLNQNNATNVNKLSAKFGAITFTTGSNFSIIKGLTQTNSNSLYRLFIHSTVDDITIESCYIPDISINDADGAYLNNIQVHKCYIWDGGVYTSTNSLYDGIETNFIFTNNIVNGQLYLSNGSNGIISNNLFLSNTFYTGNFSSFEIHNNILLAANTDNVTIQPIPDGAVSNNISIVDAFGSDNNNQTFANANFLFVGADGNSTDGQYQLAENSPAKDAANNGGDIGPFGGNDPYRLSGEPNLPIIFEFTTGGLVIGDELPVHIKAKQ